jgi:hypothetical protein
MIAIGATQLSDNLLLPEIKNLPRRLTSTRYTMSPSGSRAVIQSAAINNGQLITLVDEGPLGVLTGDQIDAINAYRASGERVTFVHHTGTWQVIVLEVEVTQGIMYADPIGTDTYFGRITMQITG